jgi:hypothetical protein
MIFGTYLVYIIDYFDFLILQYFLIILSNVSDVIAYVLPIYTSMIWIQENEIYIIPLLSFSCLFLDIKFLLFFSF